jgi:pantocin A family RiPP
METNQIVFEDLQERVSAITEEINMYNTVAVELE